MELNGVDIVLFFISIKKVNVLVLDFSVFNIENLLLFEELFLLILGINLLCFVSFWGFKWFLFY